MLPAIDQWTAWDWAAFEEQLQAEAAAAADAAFEEELRLEALFDGWDYDAGRPLPGYEDWYGLRLEERCYTPGCGHSPEEHDQRLPFNPCDICTCPVLYQPYAAELDQQCVCSHAFRAHSASSCDWCDCEGFSFTVWMPPSSSAA